MELSERFNEKTLKQLIQIVKQCTQDDYKDDYIAHLLGIEESLIAELRAHPMYIEDLYVEIQDQADIFKRRLVGMQSTAAEAMEAGLIQGKHQFLKMYLDSIGVTKDQKEERLDARGAYFQFLRDIGLVSHSEEMHNTLIEHKEKTKARRLNAPSAQMLEDQRLIEGDWKTIDAEADDEEEENVVEMTNAQKRHAIFGVPYAQDPLDEDSVPLEDFEAEDNDEEEYPDDCFIPDDDDEYVSYDDDEIED